MEKRIAPWPDFAGKVIYEGDTIGHPSGQAGIVICLDGSDDEVDRWRVQYFGDAPDKPLSRLCLQIGDRGMAVVIRRIHEDVQRKG